ncbi:thioredoxin [Pseudomonas alliivorans]|uniref:thioredoxin n=1 Tax=Pseudomonas alliivorans TaxID=2810613 RepID=UPI001AE49627|nr:thioredoxin [Pseudomonas alliivorans]MBP0942672.1 thioredoxin [Pseudomonas alliivorans]MEE4370779.1 thioredoxin [Pseudomonas alliivorans]MEE4572365.1 thioredoxin [Pseudomonas alliivorans]MEE4671313.1 thioredoxin [Pseudomonas alliivorans]MEE4675034.1 thioredoxin [Pseudomonas alliivorans]
MIELQLSDFDIDHQLLELPGTSLVIFTSAGCSACRWARQQLPEMGLAVDRLCWIDAQDNGGAVQRYEVFHLPALFLVRDGAFYGAIRAPLRVDGLLSALDRALGSPPDELP